MLFIAFLWIEKVRLLKMKFFEALSNFKYHNNPTPVKSKSLGETEIPACLKLSSNQTPTGSRNDSDRAWTQLEIFADMGYLDIKFQLYLGRVY